MPEIIGGSRRVVETESLTIDEYVGNVATNGDKLSVAVVKVASPTAEPWLTLGYDEWMCVLKGVIHIHHPKGMLKVSAGQTIFIRKGERFRPEFPEGGTEYVPICFPAFRPDRCLREDDPSGAVPLKLAELHGSTVSAKKARTELPEVLYHMCQKGLWQSATSDGGAYFPPTFDVDGGFTHATAVPARLIETANHFYQKVPGEWICLQFTRSALRRCGIIVKDEAALPVGEQAVSSTWSEWVCPHIYGGIPPQVVEAELAIVRDGALFKAIEGL
mmetsp:Transcript_46724/g.77337  ORF Transcript_46724/g.77337 Transcript_46724/m.77337 type:complete len:274 (+) Transcript_46724:20-841(+)|eukprot:CAMPEP_0119313040 /NCGR_PEP_ID=MMETSP1333-20130426/27636_1 /TAXON_ID=418940 /ORGANISM="Scyphosphaera apsteinii, Strain RCC1455" /LENGTH=273 /DNA_ID=CAMNT_0007317763 /DNA_START=20 /DNA_END=844 /DNA_ORIENTATION=+